MANRSEPAAARAVISTGPQYKELLCARLQSLAQACQPTAADHQSRMEVITAARNALTRAFARGYQGVTVQAYGSFASGFYNSSSDLDISFSAYMETAFMPPEQRAEMFRDMEEQQFVDVSTLDKPAKTKLLKKLANKLVDCGVTERRSLTYILHARVPILTFYDRTHGIECDLCIGDNSTPFKAWFVGQVASIHPSFTPLFAVVKAWAKANHINDGAMRSFNSWCLTLLVIFHMQHLQLIPPLWRLLFAEEPPLTAPRLLQPTQPGSDTKPHIGPEVYEVVKQRVLVAQSEFGSRPAPDLATLFEGFLRSLGALLNAAINGSAKTARVSTFHGRLVNDAPFPQKPYVLLVEDPFNADDNPGRTVGTWDAHQANCAPFYLAHVANRSAYVMNVALHGAQAANEIGQLSARGASGALHEAALNAALVAVGPVSSPPGLDSNADAGRHPPLEHVMLYLFGHVLLGRGQNAVPGLALHSTLYQFASVQMRAGVNAAKIHREVVARGISERAGSALLNTEDAFVSMLKRPIKAQLASIGIGRTAEQEEAVRVAKAERRTEKRKVKDSAAGRAGQGQQRHHQDGEHAAAEISADTFTAAASASAALMGEETSTSASSSNRASRRLPLQPHPQQHQHSYHSSADISAGAAAAVQSMLGQLSLGSRNAGDVGQSGITSHGPSSSMPVPQEGNWRQEGHDPRVSGRQRQQRTREPRAMQHVSAEQDGVHALNRRSDSHQRHLEHEQQQPEQRRQPPPPPPPPRSSAQQTEASTSSVSMGLAQCNRLPGTDVPYIPDTVSPDNGAHAAAGSGAGPSRQNGGKARAPTFIAANALPQSDQQPLKAGRPGSKRNNARPASDADNALHAAGMAPPSHAASSAVSAALGKHAASNARHSGSDSGGNHRPMGQTRKAGGGRGSRPVSAAAGNQL